MANIDPSGRANLLACLVWLVASQRRFVREFLRQHLRTNLRSADLARLHAAGSFPSSAHVAEWEANALKTKSQMVQGLARSFGQAAGLTGILAMIAWWQGAIDPSLPVSWSRVLQAGGTAVAVWAALFGAGGASPTWKGTTLPELLGPRIAIVLAMTGAVLALWGTLLP